MLCTNCVNQLRLIRRGFRSSSIAYKIIPNNLKGKSKTAQDWLTRQLNDVYIKKSRYENYRARSAFKLIEIDDKFKILEPGMTIVECGAAPGAWTQVLVRRLKLDYDSAADQFGGKVIAFDIAPIHPVDGATVMPGIDITKPLNQAKLIEVLNGQQVDLVCSDMAPKPSGIKDMDHETIMALCYSAFQFASNVLKPSTGMFLTKLWDGSRTSNFSNELSRLFEVVKMIKPNASRKESAEIYILARNFKGVIRK